MDISFHPKLMKYSFLFLRFFKLFPPKYQTFKPGLLYRIQYMFIIGLAISLLASICYNIYYVSQNGGSSILYGQLAYGISILGTSYLFVITVFTSSEFMEAYNDLLDFKEFGEPGDLKPTYRFINKLCVINLTYVNIIVIMHSTYALLNKATCEAGHAAIGYPIKCLFLEIILPLDIEIAHLDIYIFIWQMCTAIFMCEGGAVCSFSFYEASTYVVLKIRHLNRKLTEMFDGEDREQHKRNLVECIRYHSHIMRVVKKLNNCYRRALFVHALVTAIVFSLMANLIKQEHKPADVLHLLAWVYSTFLSCFSAQTTISESELISGAIFQSKWYKADLTIKRNVLFMLNICRRDIVFYAGPVGVLSLQMFTAIMQTAYSYLALIQSIRN